MNLNFKVLEGGYLPIRKHVADAGFDLFAPCNFAVHSESFKFLMLRVCVEVPSGYTGLILGRSSLSRDGINAFTSVIDSGYTGELGVTLFNTTCESIVFCEGERIAQLVITKIADIKTTTQMPFSASERGANGFGSTGRF